jgi:hypothetical protein
MRSNGCLAATTTACMENDYDHNPPKIIERKGMLKRAKEYRTGNFE